MFVKVHPAEQEILIAESEFLAARDVYGPHGDRLNALQVELEQLQALVRESERPKVWADYEGS